MSTPRPSLSNFFESCYSFYDSIATIPAAKQQEPDISPKQQQQTTEENLSKEVFEKKIGEVRLHPKFSEFWRQVLRYYVNYLQDIHDLAQQDQETGEKKVSKEEPRARVEVEEITENLRGFIDDEKASVSAAAAEVPVKKESIKKKASKSPSPTTLPKPSSPKKSIYHSELITLYDLDGSIFVNIIETEVMAPGCLTQLIESLSSEDVKVRGGIDTAITDPSPLFPTYIPNAQIAQESKTHLDDILKTYRAIFETSLKIFDQDPSSVFLKPKLIAATRKAFEVIPDLLDVDSKFTNFILTKFDEFTKNSSKDSKSSSPISTGSSSPTGSTGSQALSSSSGENSPVSQQSSPTLAKTSSPKDQNKPAPRSPSTTQDKNQSTKPQFPSQIHQKRGKGTK